VVAVLPRAFGESAGSIESALLGFVIGYEHGLPDMAVSGLNGFNYRPTGAVPLKRRIH
jgi:hypothetical protein